MEKSHAAVARSAFKGQNVKNMMVSGGLYLVGLAMASTCYLSEIKGDLKHKRLQ